MKTVRFVIGIHNHQPVGNFDFVFEEAFQKAYRPFLDVLEQFPAVRIGMHHTGIVLDWIDRTYPEYIVRLRNLVERGQVELIGGAYYEPILSSIPDYDKIGQIKKLSAYLQEKFGPRPEGMWIAERVWESHFPKPVSQAMMKYVILDDTHFKYTGLEEEQLTGYFLSEEEGYKINIFPISKKTRYLIPFQEPRKTIEYLKSFVTEDGRRTIVFADDGEKFGIWPQTHRHVYEEGWLRKFFQLLTDNADWIRMTHFSEALRELRPVGRVYLPNASYAEMQHWALPVDAFQQYERFEEEIKKQHWEEPFGVFVRGGFWRHFLVKYAESNRMHKKMMRLSQRVQMLHAAAPNRPDSYDEDKLQLLEKAQDHVWAAQCNCPYWHGVFGGIYLNNIRYAMYREMLTAENFLDAVEYGDRTDWHQYHRIDYDMDGRDEVLIETRFINLYLAAEEGAPVVELDYKDVPLHLTDSLTRREEGYHSKLVEFQRRKERKKARTPDSEKEIASIHDRILTKQENLHEHLVYDLEPRRSFVDRFLPVTVDLESFYRCRYEPLGYPSRASWTERNRLSDDCVEVAFEGLVAVQKQPIRMVKTFSLKPGASEVTVLYEIEHTGRATVEFLFGVELNLTLLAGYADDRYYYFNGVNLEDRSLASMGVVDQVREMGMADRWLSVDVNLQSDPPSTVWRHPVETVSLSEEGFEKVYQNSCLFPHWKMRLKPSERASVKLQLSLSRSVSRP